MRDIKVFTKEMSTKNKISYTASDITKAETENKSVSKHFARKSKRRRTVQVRLSDKWHKKLKEEALSEKTTISSLLDKICKYFF